VGGTGAGATVVGDGADGVFLLKNGIPKVSQSSLYKIIYILFKNYLIT
jgi:hypothetical protein